MSGLQKIQARLMMGGMDHHPPEQTKDPRSLALKQVLLTARRNITKKLNFNPFLSQPDHDLAT
jgi:hypothetical protein